MGMTLWIHTLEGRNYSRDSDDHSLMNRHRDALDALCEDAGVRKLTGFVDYTDQEYGFDDDDDPADDDPMDDDMADELDAEPAIDPETDLAYGIDDMTWFSAAEGLASLQAVRDALETEGLAGADDGEVDELLDEIEDCITILEGPASRGGQFHLALID
jgi:hypothetical protein